MNSRVRRLNQFSPEAKLLTGFGLAFATLIAVGTVQYRSIQVLVETDGWVAHTHAVLTELEATYSYLQRAESGTRGYVATGQNDYLTLQASGVRDSAGHFHSARRLTADNATQQRNLDKLAVLVGRKTLVMRRIVALRHDQGFAAASQELGKGEGLQLMNEIRAAVDGMEAEENRLLEIRQAGSRASARRSNAAIALGTLLALAFILAAGSISSRDALRHRRAVREREESEAAFRTLADNVPQLVWMCTPDGLNVYFNQRWVEYTGLTLQQSYGRNWSTPFHPDDRQGAWDAWNHATATGETYVVESRLRAADGNFRWFLMRGVPLHDASGVIVKWFGTCTDIDDLKRAEEALRTTTEALRQASAYNRSLIEASLDPLVTIASDGKITDVNMATEKVTGRSREELIGTDFSDYFTEPEKARAGYQQAFREGSVQDYELGIRHRDGHTTPVLYNAALYRDQAAEVVGIFAAARDITAQKQASQYARSLIEASLDPLVTISPEGKITDVNEATVKVTGVPRERLIGTDFSNYFTEPEQARSGYREVFEKGSVTDYPLTIRHRSGRLTDVLYNASVYRDAHGKVLGVFAAARDVTESRRVNQELAETKDFLDNILQSSTRYSIIGKDLNHHILSWNEGARRNYGYLAEEIIGRNATVLHSPEDVESGRVDALLKAALENGLAEGEFQRVRKDGSRFTASVVLTRRDDASGHPIGYLLMSNDISEKKKAEDALRLSEERYRSLTLASAQLIWTTDAQGLVVQDMPYWRAFTGQTEQEIRGRGWADAVHPEDRERTAATWSKAVETTSLYETEYRIRRKDGEYRHVAVRGVPVLETQGTIREWVGTCTDVTERKRAEEALRESKRRLDLAQEAGKLGSWEWFIDTGQVIYTPQMEAIYGLPPGGFGGRYENWRRAIHPDDIGPLELDLRDVLDGKKDYDSEFRILWPDGSIHWMAARGSLVHDGEHGPVRMIGMNVDITDRKRAEQALRDSKRRLDLAQKAGKMGSWEWTIGSGDVLWTPELEAVYGLEPGAFGGKYENWRQAVHPDDLEHAEKDLFGAVQSGTDFSSEFRVIWPDGSVHWVAARGSALYEGGDRPARMIGINLDISDRKRAEETLKKYTADLARSNADLEQFAYVASHDLQEPLRMVASFTQLLAQRYRGKLGGDAEDFIGYAVDGARRMQVLLNDLLAYSRVGTRGKELALTSSEAVLEAALTNLMRSIEEAGATVTHDSLPVVMADETQLIQVFQNLVGNALKFHGSEPPRVHISAQPADGQWRFSVRDNGIGIDPRHADRIFVIFQRLHTSAEYPGTGLGLAISKKIVERHGGRIWMESEPGKGATFYFTMAKAVESQKLKVEGLVDESRVES